MIAYETRLGDIRVSNNYLTKLIGKAASSCFGVVAMAPSGKQKIYNIFSKKQYDEKGIKVRGDVEHLVVELHIIAAYGMNINAVAESISHKVKYVVKDITGINVSKVLIKIDGIKE